MDKDLDNTNEMDTELIEIDLEQTQDYEDKNSNEITSVGMDFQNMSEEQRKKLSKDTAMKIAGRNFEEIVNLNYEAINKAVKIIENDAVKHNGLKVLITELLKMITELSDVSKEMFNYKSQAFLTETWDTEFDKKETNDGGYADKISKVQDYLSKNHPEVLNLSNKDAKKSETTKEIIRAFVIKENIILEGSRSLEDSSETIIKSILGFDILDDAMTQPENTPFEDFVEEIRVDDYNDIRIVRGGREERTNLSFASPEHALLFAQKLIRSGSTAVPFGVKHPFARLRIGATTRVSIMRDPIATRDQNLSTGPVVHMVIRRQRTNPFTTDFLINNGSISPYGDKLLRTILRNGISVCVYGGTGTGKTAMFNAYATAVLNQDRTFTLAEVDEMKLRKLDTRQTIRNSKSGEEIKNPHYNKALNSVLMWESTDLNTPIIGNLKGFTGMFNASLTMTPSTIIIQESKSGEVADLVEAAISDHQVSTTIHCFSGDALPYRMLMMYQQSGTKMSERSILRQCIDAFPVVVGCRRYKDGSRKIATILEYKGYKPETDEFITNTMMAYVVEDNFMGEDGKLVIEGNHLTLTLPSPILYDRMKDKGMLGTEWNELEREYKRTMVAEKPAGIDMVKGDDF